MWYNLELTNTQHSVYIDRRKQTSQTISCFEHNEKFILSEIKGWVFENYSVKRNICIDM